MKKIYTDTKAGNKVKALKIISKKRPGITVEPATFQEPSITEHSLMSLTDIKRAATTRAYRPSVDAAPNTGDWLIGIQKAFYQDTQARLFLVLAVSVIQYGLYQKPTVRLEKVLILKDKHDILTTYHTLNLFFSCYIGV